MDTDDWLPVRNNNREAKITANYFITWLNFEYTAQYLMIFEEKKILFLVTEGILKYGGYFVRVQKEIKILKKLGVKRIDLLVVGKFSSKNLISEQERLKYKLGVKDVCFFNMIPSPRLRRLVLSYKVLHAQNLIAAFYSVLMTRFNSQRKRPKIILDYHGVSPEETYCMYGSKLRFYIYKIIERFVLRAADYIIVVSHSFKEHLVHEFHLDPDKIFIIKNFIEESFFTITFSDKRELRKELGLPQNKCILVYQGGLQQWQEIDSLKRIWQFVKANPNDFHFLMLSSESTSALDFLEPEGDWFNCLSIRREDVFKYLWSCNIGLLLRKDDLINRVADPTKLGEYLTCGLEILVSGVKEAKELTQKYEIGHFLESDIRKVSNSELLEVILPLAERSKNGNSSKVARNAAKEVYSEELAYLEMNRCYADGH